MSKKILFNFGIFFLLIAPVLGLSIFYLIETKKILTRVALFERQEVVSVTSLLVKERLDRVVDVGITFATPIQFKRFIEEEDWNSATNILQSGPGHFSYVDQLALFDADGTLRGMTNATPEVEKFLGENFSQTDFYLGVMASKKPYVSKISQTSLPFGSNLVPVAVPVFSETQKFLGFIVLSLKLESISEWVRNINPGKEGEVFVVDKGGHLVAHPTLDIENEIVNYSNRTSVQNVLSGKKDIEEITNDGENFSRIAVYEPVASYGWGVVMSQPKKFTFEERTRALTLLSIVFSFIVLVASISAVWIVRNRILLLKSNAKDKALLDSIGEGVIATDNEGRIIFFNSAAEEFLRIQSDDIIKKMATEIISLSDEKGQLVPLDERPINRVLKTRKKFVSAATHPYYYERKDKSKFPAKITVTPIEIEGALVGTIEVFRDISLERGIDLQKSEFISIASHQLRTPLTSIRLFTEMLLGDLPKRTSKKHREYLENISLSALAMTKLVGNLLSVARIESGRTKFVRQKCHLAQLVSECVMEVKPLAQENSVRISFEKEKELLLNDTYTTSVDKNQFRQVIHNFLTNAIRYSPRETGMITVRLSQKNGEYIVSVSDNGIGITGEASKKIFKKFFRAKNAHKIIADGSGLGLYTAKMIMEAMGGRVEFSSEGEGTGTTFFAYLPKKAAHGSEQGS